MNVMIFDIESNGLPLNKYAPLTDVDNWPRCIELAWEKCNLNEEVLAHYASLVKPAGWVIPKEKFWIEHGFSTEESLAKGVPMEDILDLFINDIDDADILVAHNMAFDHPVLSAEMIRYGKKARRVLHKICTMEQGKAFCKIPFGNDHRPWKNDNWKFPKLEELHRKLFNEDFEGAHDAGSDVKACRKCFFELVRKGIITLEGATSTVRS